MMSRLLMFMIVVFWFQNASAASWICTPEATSGFSRDTGKWVSGRYENNSPLLIREPKSGEGIVLNDQPTVFVAQRVDNPFILAFFHTKFWYAIDSLESDVGAIKVFVDTENLSYTAISYRKFLENPNSNQYTPYMEVGGCIELG